MAAPPRIAPPTPQVGTEFFWEGLHQRHLRLQLCCECGRLRFPPMPTCPYCSAATTELRTLSGRGSVYSYVVAHVAFLPAFEQELPYAIGLIGLEEGPRLPARIEDFEGIAIGDQVQAEFHDHGSWTELRFRPATSLPDAKATGTDKRLTEEAR